MTAEKKVNPSASLSISQIILSNHLKQSPANAPVCCTKGLYSNCFVMFTVCSLMRLQSTETLQPPESTCSPEQQTTEVNDPSLFSQPQLSAEVSRLGMRTSVLVRLLFKSQDYHKSIDSAAVNSSPLLVLLHFCLGEIRKLKHVFQ